MIDRQGVIRYSRVWLVAHSAVRQGCVIRSRGFSSCHSSHSTCVLGRLPATCAPSSGVLARYQRLLEWLHQGVFASLLRECNERLPAGIIGQFGDEDGLQRLEQGRPRSTITCTIPCDAVAWRSADGVTAVGSPPSCSIVDDSRVKCPNSSWSISSRSPLRGPQNCQRRCASKPAPHRDACRCARTPGVRQACPSRALAVLP